MREWGLESQSQRLRGGGGDGRGRGPNPTRSHCFINEMLPPAVQNQHSAGARMFPTDKPQGLF